jgi:membrane protease YdiL (CAAX protease family)
MSTPARRQIVTFLVLTFAFSSVFYFLIISRGRMTELYTGGLMWSPGVAALITKLIYQKNLRGIGWGWGKTRWQALSYFAPPLLALVVYAIVWLTGIGGYSEEPLMSLMAREVGQEIPFAATLLLFATVGFLLGGFFALGEEIGWRGLLVPELAKTTSFTRLSLISGAIWSVYHYPILLFADYNSGTNKAYALFAFTWMVVASSFIYAWFRLRSGSVWTAVILHASHNLFIQQVFDQLTVDRGITRYITTEFGVGLAIAYTVVAWICWRKRGELPVAAEAAPAAAPLPVNP